MTTIAKSDFLEFDMSAAAEDFEAAKESSSEDLFLKIKPGENVLRILPPPVSWLEWFQQKGQRPEPFFVLWKHFYESSHEPGKYIAAPCPEKMGIGRCPICEEIRRLRASSDPIDRASADDMQPKHRFLMNVIDRSSPTGPKIYEGSYPYRKFQGKSAYEKIRKLMVGVTGVNLVTPTADGRDLVISKEGSGREGTTYTFQADPRGGRPLSDNSSQALEWVNSQPDLRKFITPPTEEQILDIMAGRRPGESAGPVVQVKDAPREALPAASAMDHLPGDPDDDLAF
ncbi:MAG: hypothetical protein CMQ40_13000 [Gammaproteobacteria bacterium]|nr:hypothetical protein [Gammaproteobacteria bacterium]